MSNNGQGHSSREQIPTTFTVQKTTTQKQEAANL